MSIVSSPSNLLAQSSKHVKQTAVFFTRQSGHVKQTVVFSTLEQPATPIEVVVTNKTEVFSIKK